MKVKKQALRVLMDNYSIDSDSDLYILINELDGILDYLHKRNNTSFFQHWFNRYIRFVNSITSLAPIVCMTNVADEYNKTKTMYCGAYECVSDDSDTQEDDSEEDESLERDCSDLTEDRVDDCETQEEEEEEEEEEEDSVEEGEEEEENDGVDKEEEEEEKGKEEPANPSNKKVEFNDEQEAIGWSQMGEEWSEEPINASTGETNPNLVYDDDLFKKVIAYVKNTNL